MIFCDSSFIIALLLGADTLCSLDLRQRDLAKAAGLKLLPLRMPK